MTRSLFSPLFSSHLGFDSFFNEVNHMLDHASTEAIQGGFPPLNVYKDGENYTIELAVAGFKEGDITIEHDEKNGRLSISGDTGSEASASGRQVIKQGIAHRKFTRAFTIANTLKVERANLENGLLSIYIKADEEKTYAPRRIPLSASAPEPIDAGPAGPGLAEPPQVPMAEYVDDRKIDPETFGYIGKRRRLT